MKTALLLLCLAFGSALHAQAQPNFLIITADDLNCDSVGAFGSTMADTTPHIDQLAAQGMRYDKAHVASTACMPCAAS